MNIAEGKELLAKATPGEWKNRIDDHGTSQKIFAPGSFGYPLATVSSYWRGDGPPDDERDANAELIAWLKTNAADLFAAIERKDAALEKIVDMDNDRSSVVVALRALGREP